ncbi:hypothetical protein ACIPYV_16665 [Paenarthrobacter nicotinovorans]|uniref:hypothetical protein n=1 Tax=Paenarthrobacter nicotinovorans TaxID=29320 RepID=UPI00380C1B96
MAEIPGINEPPEHILFAQTTQAPDWSRIEWAKQLLTHTYTLTAPEHAAPILTTISYINRWEGRETKAHQYLQLALDNDPGYRFARLTDHMLGAGIIAGWNTNKNTAYRTSSTGPEEAHTLFQHDEPSVSAQPAQSIVDNDTGRHSALEPLRGPGCFHGQHHPRDPRRLPTGQDRLRTCRSVPMSPSVMSSSEMTSSSAAPRQLQTRSRR